MFAHRGGARLRPENTLVAFEHAVALGADGLECDVHLSRDGVPVVIHDATLERTTDARGPVAAMAAAELARVDAGYYFDAGGGYAFRGRGIGVPTLDEMLRRFDTARVIVEMKGSTPTLARAVVDTVRNADAAERVCVGSFHEGALDVVRALAPELATSASASEVQWTLYRSWIRLILRSRRRYVAFQVPERSGRLAVVSPTFVRHVHREGQIVQTWVIDRREDCRRLLQCELHSCPLAGGSRPRSRDGEHR
ncbi:MAG: glycerophosphodiester phosphodiesterase [Acidobacteria bacterium]|nr:glycerophosphodiester phosphodiesterase [Acidobacteriota bacterium]